MVIYLGVDSFKGAGSRYETNVIKYVMKAMMPASMLLISRVKKRARNCPLESGIVVIFIVKMEALKAMSMVS